MKKYYAIYSKRGIWVQLQLGEKMVILHGKKLAQDIADELSVEHKQKYWVEQVKITKVK